MVANGVDPGGVGGESDEGYLPVIHFRRVSARRGWKRAAAALAHTLLVVVYHVLNRREAYRDLGADYLDRLEPERLTKRLVKRLERLGLKVTIEPQTVVVGGSFSEQVAVVKRESIHSTTC